MSRLPTLVLTFLLSLSIVTVVATASAAAPPQQMPVSQKPILKLTDNGLEQSVLHMTTDDSVLFFLNDTKDSLTSLEIDFRGQTAHCASSNMKAADDGFIRSSTPFGPHDFATTCFHSKGAYEYTVYGLKPKPSGIKGKIIVE